MANTLFLISQSPNIFKLISGDDAVCFIQDGVYFSNKEGVPESLTKELSGIEAKGSKIYYLKPDLEARSLDFSGDTVDYDGLLDLIEEYNNVFH